MTMKMMTILTMMMVMMIVMMMFMMINMMMMNVSMMMMMMTKLMMIMMGMTTYETRRPPRQGVVFLGGFRTTPYTDRKKKVIL